MATDALTPMERLRIERGQASAYSTSVAVATEAVEVVHPVVLPEPSVELVRTQEATAEQIIASGAYGGAYGVDPIDGDVGYTRLGASRREIPPWTLEKARAFSVAAYRINPMARAIIDTYTSFCVGDSGVGFQCSNAEVHAVVDEFWNDPRNDLAGNQHLMLQDKMIMGELAYEMMVGATTGITRFSPIDTTRITDVELFRGNPLWPASIIVRLADGSTESHSIVAVDDLTGLRTGDVIFRPSWRALLTDRRGWPFLGPILDDLDAYDQVLSNLIDRTALMRHIAFDVTLKGPNVDQNKIDDWVRSRGGTHVPRSGSVEVHNESVEWKPLSAQVGTAEDTMTSQAVLTKVAAGAGLAKTWLAEPDNANRATSLTMAEPVRRRVGGVQNMWLADVRFIVQFAVDRAVAAGRLQPLVETTDATSSTPRMVPAASTVTITGPEIAAADAQVTAQIMQNLATSLSEMVVGKILSPEAARIAAQKAWEQFVGVPWTKDLDITGAGADDLADELDKTDPAQVNLRLA